MRHLMRPLIAVAALAALAACTERELGADADTGQFGNATMNNTQIHSGQKDYVVQLGSRFAAEVTDTVNFAFDSAVLDAEARATLDRQADWIRQFPEVRFRVYGHTDLVGSDAYNYRLGLRRAQAVVGYLAQRGISRSRLEAVTSFGRTRPVVPTTAEERRNRRTVTEVTGFVQRHPTVLNGKYAEIIFREYVQSAVPTHQGSTGDGI